MVDDGANVKEEVGGGRGVKNSTCAQEHGEDSRAIPAPRRQERPSKHGSLCNSTCPSPRGFLDCFS